MEGRHSNQYPQDFIPTDEWDEQICREYEQWAEENEYGRFDGPEEFI